MNRMIKWYVVPRAEGITNQAYLFSTNSPDLALNKVTMELGNNITLVKKNDYADAKLNLKPQGVWFEIYHD